jgi:hypothetical protein
MTKRRKQSCAGENLHPMVLIGAPQCGEDKVLHRLFACSDCSFKLGSAQLWQFVAVQGQVQEQFLMFMALCSRH